VKNSLYIAGIILIVMLEIALQAGWLPRSRPIKCHDIICVAPGPGRVYSID
jgi:hypothetical protein